jgi:hypothetical protein
VSQQWLEIIHNAPDQGLETAFIVIVPIQEFPEALPET